MNRTELKLGSAVALERSITPDDPTKMPPTLVFDGRVLLPSDPPGALTFDGTSHGGFFSTGVVGAGAPAGGKVKFKVTAPAGKYHYICLIHPEMTGTVTVK